MAIAKHDAFGHDDGLAVGLQTQHKIVKVGLGDVEQQRASPLLLIEACSEGLTTTNVMIPYGKQKKTCPFCGIVMLRKTLPRHIEDKHTQGFTHECTICHQTFKRSDILLRHQRYQHGEGNQSTECTFCGKLIRHRVMKSHLESSACIAERRQIGDSKIEQSNPPVGEQTMLLLSAQLTMDSGFNPVVICGCLYSTALAVRPWVGRNAVIPERRYRPFCERLRNEFADMRSRALLSTRKALLEQPMGVTSLLSVMLLFCADRWTLGADSPDVMAHSRYVSSICDPENPAPLPSKHQFEETAYYLLQTRKRIANTAEVNEFRRESLSPSWCSLDQWTSEQLTDLLEHRYRSLLQLTSDRSIYRSAGAQQKYGQCPNWSS